MSNVYFMYSSEQYGVKKEACARIGRTYKPGTVIVNGKMKPYTEMVNNPADATYPDAIVVTFGPKSRMNYKRGR